MVIGGATQRHRKGLVRFDIQIAGYIDRDHLGRRANWEGDHSTGQRSTEVHRIDCGSRDGVVDRGLDPGVSEPIHREGIGFVARVTFECGRIGIGCDRQIDVVVLDQSVCRRCIDLLVIGGATQGHCKGFVRFDVQITRYINRDHLGCGADREGDHSTGQRPTEIRTIDCGTRDGVVDRGLDPRVSEPIYREGIGFVARITFESGRIGISRDRQIDIVVLDQSIDRRGVDLLVPRRTAQRYRERFIAFYIKITRHIDRNRLAIGTDGEGYNTRG